MDKTLERQTVSKIGWRLLPIIILMYFLSYLDRVNVSFAALTMNKDLAFTATIYGWGAGLFFVGYFLGEVPSNLALERFGARVWLARIMITWGAISAAMALVSGPVSFYATRFLLGLAEAGLFPGVILYLTYWFPERTRSRMIALFLAAAPLSTLIGAPISSSLLGLDGAGGLRGWQWLFILEGLPTVLVGVYVLFMLPDRPESVEWLDRDERAWLTSKLAAENAQRAEARIHGVGQALRNPRVLGYCLWYLLVVTGLYGVGFWMPQVVRALGFSVSEVGWLVAIPSVVTAALMIPWSVHSDRSGERLWHTILPALVAVAGLLLAAKGGTPALIMTGFTLASVGVFSAIPPFWALPVATLSGSAAAAGIAIIGAVGNLGGYFGPLALGMIKDATGGFSIGLLALAASVALSCPLVWMLERARTRGVMLRQPV
ncbi:MFS transporter [Bradyrhizobium sp. NP1]|uniref:MFS transporter n=1 Tax=Bradyrhizobium sp. NP1 TaxID=3049772 RepID=UPI0025A5D3E1|nr:MFS transporter [Bradyrhizobium sp. NP1]WJR80903.1 MFS transporter [Bradyrhizobium sp. NP1]